MTRVSIRERFPLWISLFAAIALLNVSLTFANVWPTLGITWRGGLSAELAAVLALFVWRFHRTGAPPSPRLVRRTAWVWVFLAVGHYIDVTARSLYGRDVNLYWDLKLLPNVSAMFASVASVALVVAVVAGVVILPWLLAIPLRWAFRQVADATAVPQARGALLAAAGLVAALAGLELLGHPAAVVPPVSLAYATEAAEFVQEASGIGEEPLPEAPAMDANLAHVRGADVLLIFLEAYGVVSWEKPELVRGLAGSRQDLARAIAETHRGVVSAMVESTTFGGESWLAHISLLSGLSVKTPDVNARLMRERGRDTMVKAFGRQGFRTVAVMPGLQLAWPEGAFYGFQRIYGTKDLNYQGPPFSWWDLTDQFTLARLDEMEIARTGRQPVFAFFPTISTHAPFTPAPPYQPDWARVLTPLPYDQAALDDAWSRPPDWTNLTPSYGEALNYSHAVLSGYLRHRADRDLVVVIVGDHQPAAFVSGEGAAWDVPVHVITSRPAVRAGLRAQGFKDGLAPDRTVIATMDGLLPKLLDAFSEPPALASRQAPGPGSLPNAAPPPAQQ